MSAISFAAHHCLFFLCCKAAVPGQGRKVPFSGKSGERERSWAVPCQENSNPGVQDFNSAAEQRLQEHSHIPMSIALFQCDHASNWVRVGNFKSCPSLRQQQRAEALSQLICSVSLSFFKMSFFLVNVRQQ